MTIPYIDICNCCIQEYTAALHLLLPAAYVTTSHHHRWSATWLQALAVIENSPTDLDFPSVYDLAPKDEARAAVVTWQALQSARVEADAGQHHLASPAAQQPYLELQHAADTAHAELREKLQDPDRAVRAGDNIQARALKDAAHKALVSFLAAVLQRMTSTAALPAKEFLAQLPPLVSGLANTVLVMRDALKCGSGMEAGEMQAGGTCLGCSQELFAHLSWLTYCGHILQSAGEVAAGFHATVLPFLVGIGVHEPVPGVLQVRFAWALIEKTIYVAANICPKQM